MNIYTPHPTSWPQHIVFGVNHVDIGICIHTAVWSAVSHESVDGFLPDLHGYVIGMGKSLTDFGGQMFEKP